MQSFTALRQRRLEKTDRHTPKAFFTERRKKKKQNGVSTPNRGFRGYRRYTKRNPLFGVETRFCFLFSFLEKKAFGISRFVFSRLCSWKVVKLCILDQFCSLFRLAQFIARSHFLFSSYKHFNFANLRSCE